MMCISCSGCTYRVKPETVIWMSSSNTKIIIGLRRWLEMSRLLIVLPLFVYWIQRNHKSLSKLSLTMHSSCSCMVVVHKPSGHIWLCRDPKDIHVAMRHEYYPMPSKKSAPGWIKKKEYPLYWMQLANSGK